MLALTVDEIDREIASRAREADAMSATLVEVEEHPGLAHVRRYPPTGVTAQRWVKAQASLEQLWEDLRRLTTMLDEVKAVRGRRSRLDESDRARCTRLLRERHMEVSRQRIPLAQRLITDPAEAAVCVGFADTVDRMRGAFSAVVAFLDSVDEVESVVVRHVAPIQKLLDGAGVEAPKEIAELLSVSASDPLSLTSHDLRLRVSIIEKVVQRRQAELAELTAVQANWPQSVADAATQLDALRDAVADAAQVRARAERTVITSPLPVHEDVGPVLRAELETVGAKQDARALRALLNRVEAALAEVRADRELAQGLLDRRDELAGRLSIYQAKAARLGLAEDRDLLACDQIAAGLLARRPCDLRAATRAVAAYQQQLVEKQGKRR